MAYIYAFFMSIVGATSAAAMKYIGHAVSVEFITFWQFLICFAISVAILAHKRISPRQIIAIDKADRWVLLVRGLSGLLGFYAFYAAINQIPLIEATLLRHSSPLFVPLIAFLWFGLKTSKTIIGFIVIGFIGVYITLNPQTGSASFNHLIGLSAGIFLSLSMVTTNRLKKYDSAIVLFYYFFTSLIGMLVPGVSHWQSVTVEQALLIAYIGTSIYIAMYLYNKAFTLSHAANISPMTYLSVVHAGILGFFIWGYVPSWLSIVGMSIVVACGIATTLAK